MFDRTIDQNHKRELPETIDDLAKCLHDHSPSKYTYSIIRNLYHVLSISLSIQKEI